MERVCVSGDPEAFAWLVRRWQGAIQRLSLRMTGDLHRSEDIAQEAFARVFVGRTHYRAEARFSTYLWQIALNLCRDELRRSSLRKTRSLEDGCGMAEPEDHGPGPDDCASRSDEGQRVRRALLLLDPIHREVLVLRHYEGLKFREIAAVLRVPEGTVKSRMAEALSRMAGLLEVELDRKGAGVSAPKFLFL